MDENVKYIFGSIGLTCESFMELNGILIPREQLLSIAKYNEVKHLIPKLKIVFSSSSMTSLQKGAFTEQKYPLLNLTRQILNVYNFEMVPIRKSDGYTVEGVKKYKRFFQIQQKKLNESSLSM